MKKRLLLLTTIPISALALDCPVDEMASLITDNPYSDTEEVYVEADRFSATKKIADFYGNVIAKQKNHTFRTNILHYNRITRDIKTPEQLAYGNQQFALRAKQSGYSLIKEYGEFEDVNYFLPGDEAVGSAEHVTVDRKKQTKLLKNASYTTCRRDNPNWHFKAKEIKIHDDEGYGESWHTTFHIGDTPVMYLPYLSFPINDERKTGFLFPTIKYSRSRGVDLTIPFYINIAPNHDATLYPRILFKKGLMLGGEYRYLLPDLAGTVAGTYLNNDKTTGTKRWSFKTKHRYQPNDKFFINLDYQRVSDKYYIEDFDNTLDLSNKSFIESRLDISYKVSPNYQIKGRLSDFQVADKKYTKANEPYSILPQINGHGKWTKDNWTLVSDTDMTNFDKDNKVSGVRFNQKLDLSYLYENSYSFIKPTLSYQFTTYQLRDQANGKPDSITRSLPTFSLDSGLYFDRQVELFGKNMTQTLSPRLFYLYTPYSDQSDIPNFDSSLVSSTYSSLFLNNRFKGKDRIGDANQLTTAVSTTFTDNTSGRELAKFSAGQIQYFQDRRVSLNNSIAKTLRSNIIAEGSISPNNNIKINGLIHYDTNKDRTEKSLFGISYYKEKDKILNLTHNFDQTYFKQVDFSGVWRMNDYWRAFWRWNYAIDYSKTIDILAGVEYADCCWGVRLMARQQRTSVKTDVEPENTVYLEFVLKGLGNIGTDTTSELRSVIPRYQPIHYEDY